MIAKDAQRFPLSSSKSFRSAPLEMHKYRHVITSGMYLSQHTEQWDEQRGYISEVTTKLILEG